MKFPIQIQFHRPEFLKSDDHPTLKKILHKEKDDPTDANQRAEAIKQRERSNRHRIFGGLVTVNLRSAQKKTAAPAQENVHATGNPLPFPGAFDISPSNERDRSDENPEDRFRKLADDLSKAWPEDRPRTENDPPAFLALAAQCQAEKAALFASAGGDPGKLQTALACANILHAKEGHNDNVVSVAKAFLEDEGIKNKFYDDLERLIIKGEDKEFFDNILLAAQWHGLADRDIPVSVLTAKRAPSAEDKAQYIDRRSGNSADIYEGYGFSNEDVSALIRQTRVFGDESFYRTLAPQFLDLMDRISAMGAKPFFRTEGKVDAVEIFAAIDKDLARDNIHIDAELKNLVRSGVERGLLDNALLPARAENTYVRT